MNLPLAVSPSLAPDNAAPRIAFVQSCWHREIVDRACTGFTAELATLGYAPEQIETFEVPGAYELPLRARLLAKSGRYAAIVAAGLVVDGGIYRHEFVAQAVIDGLMRCQLELELPILSVVLTPHHFHEHDEHRRYFGEHFVHKGAEAARACAAIIDATRKVRALSAVVA